MNILEELVLDTARVLHLDGPLRLKMMRKTLAQMLTEKLIITPVLLPARDVPIAFLDKLRRLEISPRERHPGALMLNGLLRKGEAISATVPIKKIQGVWNSKGELRMALDSLPETMSYTDFGDFGPLTNDRMTRLRQAVEDEFFPDGGKGVFHLDHMTWVDSYIAHNSGASRRFALLRRLSKSTDTLEAKVVPYSLDMEVLHQIRRHWRVLVAAGDGLVKRFEQAAAIEPKEFCVIPLPPRGQADNREAPHVFWLPHAYRNDAESAASLEKLHRTIDEAGIFDLARYLGEQISQFRRSHAGAALRH